MKKSLFLLSTLFFFTSYAQKYNFKNYTVEDGLAQSQVNDINQDAKGYLWIGTESGLSKFNGLNFVSYSMDNGLPDNKIEKIYFDDENTLWVGTPKGLARLEGTKFIPYYFDTPRRVNDIVEFQNKMFVATNDGLLKLENENFTLINPYLDEPLYVRALVNLNDEELICGTKTGLFTYQTEYKMFIDSTYLKYNISDLTLVDDFLFISTYGDGLLRYCISNQELFKYELKLSRIRSIYADENVILCSTINGAIEIVGEDVSYYNQGNGLINENLVCVFKDREDNYWMGTDANGLLKFLGKSIISYSTKDGMSSNIVISINQLADSSFIFGTYKEGITFLNSSNEMTYLKEQNGLKDNTVWASISDSADLRWVGSTGGVNLISNGKIVNNQIADQIKSKIKTIEKIDDKYFFAGSEGIYAMSGSEVLYLEHTAELNINDLTSNGTDLIVASRTGLYVLSDATNYAISNQMAVPEPAVNAVCTDIGQNIWVGTENGLFVLLKDGTIVPFELERDNFKSKTILGIIQSKTGDMWVSTLSGVYQISKKEGGSFNLNHYATEEGLVNLESNLNALYEDHDYNIWLGTANGLAKINPSLNNILFDFKAPELHFTGIRLFMEEFDYNRFQVEYEAGSSIPNVISLPYDQNHLTFDFIGINLKNPESVLYEYRLTGASENWSPLSNATYATYSDIAPGDYTFEVRATNKSALWSETIGIQINIRSPFWETWWFISLMIMIGSLILIGLFQARIRTIKQKQENEKLSFKNRLLFLEQQSLNASMNRHFIFNSLNSIQYFINSSDKRSANKYLSSFAKLIRKNLDSSTNDNFVVTLQEEIERISLYLTLEKMRFQEKFEYEINVSSELDTESIEIPSMILQPFVENSIIHGVLGLERVGHIEIKIYEELDNVIFEVIDDGLGIDNTLNNKKERPAGDHESKGMEITSRRIELLRKITGENLMIIGPFQINNEQGECLGTKVIIKMGIIPEQ